MATHALGLRRTIAICSHGMRKAAFDLNIKNNNVYINYQNGTAHLSMHSSGQLHFKKGSDYVKWTGGLSGEWEPMRFMKTAPTRVTGRLECGTVGWSFAQLLLLPDCDEEPDVIVCDVVDLNRDSLIAIRTSIVSPREPIRNQILGFPVVWQMRLTSGVTVELEAFVVSEEQIPNCG
jgi:hypothetical protein